jgi:hypothetical protein
MSAEPGASHSGAGPPFRTDLESNRFDALHEISLTMMQAGQAPPRLSHRLPEPHRSIRGSIERRKKFMAWFRHIAEMLAKSGVIPFR